MVRLSITWGKYGMWETARNCNSIQLKDWRYIQHNPQVFKCNICISCIICMQKFHLPKCAFESQHTKRFVGIASLAQKT